MLQLLKVFRIPFGRDMFSDDGRLILKGGVRGAVLLDSHKLSEGDVLLPFFCFFVMVATKV